MSGRTDTERLEWIAANKCDLDYSAELGWGVYKGVTGMLGEGPNVRAAIDAAMDAEGQG